MAEKLPDLGSEKKLLVFSKDKSIQESKTLFMNLLYKKQQEGLLQGVDTSNDQFYKNLHQDLSISRNEKKDFVISYKNEAIGKFKEKDQSKLENFIHELMVMVAEREVGVTNITQEAKNDTKQLLGTLIDVSHLDQKPLEAHQKNLNELKNEAKSIDNTEVQQQKSNDRMEVIVQQLNQYLEEMAESGALSVIKAQLKADIQSFKQIKDEMLQLENKLTNTTTTPQIDAIKAAIQQKRDVDLKKAMGDMLVDYITLQTNKDGLGDKPGGTSGERIEKDLCDLLRTFTWYEAKGNADIRNMINYLRDARFEKKFTKYKDKTSQQQFIAEYVQKGSTKYGIDLGLSNYMAKKLYPLYQYNPESSALQYGMAGAAKGTRGLTPGAVPGTASDIPLDPVNAVARGETGSQSSKITIKEKSIEGSTEEHLVETANLKEKSFADLLLLYSNYQDDPNGTIDSNKRMIQRYMVYNIIAGIAPGSAKDKFQQLGAGDIQQGKARFKEFMLNTIFASDYHNDLITKINMEVYTKTGASRANNSQAFAVGGTASDKFYGYGTTASSVNTGGQMSRDETIRRVASQLLASEFNTGTGALEVVFNPTTGVYETDSQAADLFREIAAARGMTHELGTDYNAKDLMKTGLHGALTLGSNTLQEMGRDKGIVDGTLNVVEAATNITQAGLTVASLYKGVQAGVNVVKGCRNFLFGEGEAYKANFDEAWKKTKSSLGYLAGREAISLIKNPSGYLENSTILQSVMNVAGSDAYKSELARKRIVEDGIIILKAKAMSEVTSQIFEGFSPKQLLEAGVIKAGSQGILVDPERMVGLPGMTQFEEYLQAMDPIQKKAFLQSQATSLAKSLVDSYGLTPAVLEEIKDSDESLPTLLRSRQLRTQTLQNVLSKIPNIPGIDKNELLKLSDADLKEKLDVLEAVGLLQQRTEKAYFDKRASNSGAEFAKTIDYNTLNSTIFEAKDRPTFPPSISFRQYRKQQLQEVAKSTTKIQAEERIANMFHVISSLAQLHDIPPTPTTPQNDPSAPGATVVPSAGVETPNYWNGKPNLYDYFSEGITGLNFPAQDACADNSSKIAENPNGPSVNFVWTDCESN